MTLDVDGSVVTLSERQKGTPVEVHVVDEVEDEPKRFLSKS